MAPLHPDHRSVLTRSRPALATPTASRIRALAPAGATGAKDTARATLAALAITLLVTLASLASLASLATLVPAQATRTLGASTLGVSTRAMYDIEPNDGISDAVAIDKNCVYAGALRYNSSDDNDVADFYRVQLETGATADHLDIEVELNADAVVWLQLSNPDETFLDWGMLPGRNATATIETVAAFDGWYAFGIVLMRAETTLPLNYTVTVETTEVPFENDNDNSFDEAAVLARDQPHEASLHELEDQTDFFTLALDAGEDLTLHLEEPASLAAYIELYDPQQGKIERISNTVKGEEVTLYHFAKQAGEYTVVVGVMEGQGRYTLDNTVTASIDLNDVTEHDDTLRPKTDIADHFHSTYRRGDTVYIEVEKTGGLGVNLSFYSHDWEQLQYVPNNPNNEVELLVADIDYTGNYTFGVKLASGTGSYHLSILVERTNDEPQLVKRIPNIYIFETANLTVDRRINLTKYFSDDAPEYLNYSIDRQYDPTNVTAAVVDDHFVRFTRHRQQWLGCVNFRLKVIDDPPFHTTKHELYSNKFMLCVMNVNDPPTIEAVDGRSPSLDLNFTATEDVSFSIEVTATDSDDDKLYYFTDSFSIGFSDESRYLNHTFTQEEVGVHHLTIYVADNETLDLDNTKSYDSCTITITVRNRNDAPEVVTVGDRSVTPEDETVAFDLEARERLELPFIFEDEDMTHDPNETVVVHCDRSYLRYFAENRSLIFTPPDDGAYSYESQVTLTDSHGATRTLTVAFTIAGGDETGGADDGGIVAFFASTIGILILAGAGAGGGIAVALLLLRSRDEYIAEDENEDDDDDEAEDEIDWEIP